MLVRYITLLRRAPKGVRQRHALFWALSVTGVIAVAWGVSLPYLMKPLPSGDGLADAKEQARPLGSLWSQARKQMAGLMDSITASSTDSTVSVTASSTEVEVSVNASGTPNIVLTTEDIQKAQARANIVYRPDTTSTTTSGGLPQVVLIATTTLATSSQLR